MRTFYSLTLILLLASCRTTEPAASQHQHATEHRPDTEALSSAKPPAHLSDIDVGNIPLPGIGVGQSPVASGAGDFHKQVADTKAGPLSSIGKLFSTPEGSARRQARKDAAAAVPKKLGKGAVYAPAAKEVLYSWKADGPVAQATDSATASAADNTKAGQRGGAAATAPHATATTTTEEAGWPWWSWLVLLGAEELITWLAFRMTVLTFLGGLFRSRKETSEPPTA